MVDPAKRETPPVQKERTPHPEGGDSPILHDAFGIWLTVDSV
jgi:hypothetical protein